MISPTTISALLTLFLGTIGQLIARIFYLNGSLDKIWLMLFALPPFSIVPAVYLFMNWVDNGTGGSVFNIFSLLIPVISVVLNSVLVYSEVNIATMSAASIALLVTNVITFTIARYMQYYTTCKSQKKELFDKNNPMQYIAKSITYSLVTFGMIYIAGKTVLPIIKYIPPASTVIRGINSAESILPGLSMGVTLVLFHTMAQMYGNTPIYQDSLCKNLIESWKN
jgi:hypothetical protein